MADREDIDRVSGAVHRRDLGRIIRFVVVVALIVILVAVAFDNRSDVRVGYLIDEAMAPGWLVIILSAVGGLMIGWLMRLRARNYRD